jgi:ABC-type uncharacterized transport system fused permease/ATPase subunit
MYDVCISVTWTCIVCLLTSVILTLCSHHRRSQYNYSIRDNAESIAFYAGEDIENKEVVNRLEKVIDNRKQINTSQRNVDFFTTSYNCECSLRCPNFGYPSDYMISTILASHVFSHSHMLFSSPQSS